MDEWIADEGAAVNVYGDISTWNTGAVEDMSELFKNRTTFNEDITAWDVSSVTNMSNMFENDISFNQNISEWNVSNVTFMTEMFKSATLFNTPINNWNVSKVQNMSGMFRNIGSAFNQDISGWVTTDLSNSSFMFSGASGFNQPIKTFDMSGVLTTEGMFISALSFNQDISGWLMHSVNNTGYMFNNAPLFNQDISGWNVSSVTDMQHMFHDAKVFNQGISNWNTSNVVKMNNMFEGDISFNQNINSWIVTKVQDMSGMFLNNKVINQSFEDWDVSANCVLTSMFEGAIDMSNNWNADPTPHYNWFPRIFNNKSELISTIDLWYSDNAKAKLIYGEMNTWHTQLVTDMSGLFQNNTTFNENISNWNVSAVTSMESMFENDASFNQPLDNWDISTNMINTINMFRNSGFNQPINSWNVSSVLNMSSMFENTPFNQPLDNWRANNLQQLRSTFKDSLFNQPINSWNVSNLLNADYAFSGTSFNQPLSNWAFGNNASLGYFLRDSKFNNPINSWDVSTVTSMKGLFYGLTDFNQPLDKWNVSSVTNMQIMFNDATSFMQEIRNWDVSANTENMFSGATNMINIYQYSDNWSISPPVSWFVAPSESYDNNFNSIQVSTISSIEQNLTVQNMLDTTSDFYKSIDNSFDTDGNALLASGFTDISGVSIDVSVKSPTLKLNNFTMIGDNSGNTYTPTEIKLYGSNETNWSSALLEETELTQSLNSNQSNYGYNLDMDGNYLVVGDKYNNGISQDASGEVNVYKHNGYQYIHSKKLVPQNLNNANNSHFGESSSISGNYLASSAQYEHHNDVSNCGAVFIFKNDNDSWTETQKIVPTDLSYNLHFGKSLYLENDYLVVTSHQDASYNQVTAYTSNVYVFERDNTTDLWGQTLLIESDVSYNYPDDLYNQRSVQIYSNKLIIGSVGNSNRVSIYENNAGTWAKLQDITEDTYNPNSMFGYSISLYDNYLVVGSPGTGTVNFYTYNTQSYSTLIKQSMKEFDEIYASYIDQITGDTNFINQIDTESASAWVFSYTLTYNGYGNDNIYDNFGKHVHIHKYVDEFFLTVSSDNYTSGQASSDNKASVSIFKFISDAWSLQNNINKSYSIEFGRDVQIYNNRLTIGNFGFRTDGSQDPWSRVHSYTAHMNKSNASLLTTVSSSQSTKPIFKNYRLPGYPLLDNDLTYVNGDVEIVGLSLDQAYKYYSFVVTKVLPTTETPVINYLKLNRFKVGNAVLNDSNFKTIVSQWLQSGTQRNAVESDYGTINLWNTDAVTDMSGVFVNQYAFNENISNWNVSNVTTMNGMFNNAISFNQDISNWTPSKITDLGLFMGADNSLEHEMKFNQPLNSWGNYLSNCTNMNSAFKNATYFNQPLTTWNVTSVTDMGGMFECDPSGGLTTSDSWTYANFNFDASNSDIADPTATITKDIGNGFSVQIIGATSIKDYADGYVIHNSPVEEPTATITGLTANKLYYIELWQYNSGEYAYDSITGFEINGEDHIGYQGANGRTTPSWSGGITSNSSGQIVIKFTAGSNGDYGMIRNHLSAIHVQSHPNGLGVFNQSLTPKIFDPINESPVAIAAGSGTFTPGSISISKAYPNNDIETYGWNTDQLTSTVNMFKNQILFNQDITKWNTSNLTLANGMFSNADSFAQDIRSWTISNDCSLNELFINSTAMTNKFSNSNNWPSDNKTPSTTWFDISGFVHNINTIYATNGNRFGDNSYMNLINNDSTYFVSDDFNNGIAQSSTEANSLNKFALPHSGFKDANNNDISGTVISVSCNEPTIVNSFRMTGTDTSNNYTPSEIMIYGSNDTSWDTASIKHSYIFSPTKNDPALTTFGKFIAMSDTFVVSYDENKNHGILHVFKFDNAQYKYHSTLEPTGYNNSLDLRFGTGVSIHGNYIAAGSIFEHTSYYQSGAVWVFKYSNDKWSQVSKIIPNNTGSRQGFGHNTTLYNNYLAVSTYNTSISGKIFSDVFIFEANSLDQWTQVLKINGREDNDVKYEEYHSFIDSGISPVDNEHLTVRNLEFSQSGLLIVGSFGEADVSIYQRVDKRWRHTQSINGKSPYMDMINPPNNTYTRSIFGHGVSITDNALVIGDAAKGMIEYWTPYNDNAVTVVEETQTTETVSASDLYEGYITQSGTSTSFQAINQVFTGDVTTYTSPFINNLGGYWVMDFTAHNATLFDQREGAIVIVVNPYGITDTTYTYNKVPYYDQIFLSNPNYTATLIKQVPIDGNTIDNFIFQMLPGSNTKFFRSSQIVTNQLEASYPVEYIDQFSSDSILQNDFFNQIDERVKHWRDSDISLNYIDVDDTNDPDDNVYTAYQNFGYNCQLHKSDTNELFLLVSSYTYGTDATDTDSNNSYVHIFKFANNKWVFYNRFYSNKSAFAGLSTQLVDNRLLISDHQSLNVGYSTIHAFTTHMDKTTAVLLDTINSPTNPIFKKYRLPDSIIEDEASYADGTFDICTFNNTNKYKYYSFVVTKLHNNASELRLNKLELSPN